MKWLYKHRANAMPPIVSESQHVNRSTNGDQSNGRRTQKRVWDTVKSRRVDLETKRNRPYGCKSEVPWTDMSPYKGGTINYYGDIICIYARVRRQTRTMTGLRKDTCRRVQVFDTKIIINHRNSSLTVRFSSTWSGNCLCLSSYEERSLPLITSTSSGIFWVCNMFFFFTSLFDER